MALHVVLVLMVDDVGLGFDPDPDVVGRWYRRSRRQAGRARAIHGPIGEMTVVLHVACIGTAHERLEAHCARSDRS